jgi:hypothetical protein
MIQEIEVCIQEKQYGKKQKLTFPTNSPNPIIQDETAFCQKKLNIFSQSPVEFARQFTLVIFQYFTKISPMELFQGFLDGIHSDLPLSVQELSNFQTSFLAKLQSMCSNPITVDESKFFLEFALNLKMIQNFQSIEFIINFLEGYHIMHSDENQTKIEEYKRALGNIKDHVKTFSLTGVSEWSTDISHPIFYFQKQVLTAIPNILHFFQSKFLSLITKDDIFDIKESSETVNWDTFLKVASIVHMIYERQNTRYNIDQIAQFHKIITK